MNLSDLKPRGSKFFLKSANRDFNVNPVSLSDEEWLSSEYSSEEIFRVFTDIDMDEICRIAFRLMDNESKLFFKMKEVTFATEDGEEITENIGGIKLLKAMVSGLEEKIAILQALNDTFGVSRPEVKPVEPNKKKVKKKAKKKTTKKK